MHREVYGGNAEAMHKFGFDGPKLDGCGAQTDMQLWDGVFKADGGPPVMMENCHWGRKVPYEPRDAVPTTTCFALLLMAAARGRRVTKPSGTRRTWIMVPLASALGLSDPSSRRCAC